MPLAVKPSSLQSINAIAILRLGAIGDICLTVPLIRTLQKYLPNTQLTWIISRSVFGLVEGLSGVEFIVIDKPKSLRDYWRCYQQFKPFHFDVLLVPQATLRSNLLCPFIKAKIKYGYDRLHSHDGQRFFVDQVVPAYPEHLLDTFLRFAEPFGITDKVIDWQLPIAESDWEWAKQQMLCEDHLPWLAICPAASKAERNWPVERFIETIHQLQQHLSFNVVLVGGHSASEKKLAMQITESCSVRCVNLVGKSTLKQLAATLGSVKGLLSGDTGPAHIATAMGTTVIGLYAVAPSKKTGPYYSADWVIDKFDDAVKTILKRDPLLVAWHDRVHSAEAMALISVEEVVQQLLRLFT